MIDNWYQMSGEAVAEKLRTSQEAGLTRKLAGTLLKKYRKNEIYPVSKITFYNCIKSITMDYTSYLLVVTALIAAIFEESVGAWAIVILVLLNLIATLLAYTKAQKVLESMDRYTLPVVRVIRDGRLFMIEQKLLVPGDLICLSRGDIVPADARVIRAEGFFLDETHLFGEGPLRQKQADDGLHETLPPEKQRNMVFASTLVASGEATAIVCATGEDTVVCITEKNRPIINHETMPLLGKLQKISRAWSLVVIAAVFGLTLLDFLLPGLHNSLFASFIKSMSFAVSTMSEMYVAFGYIVLACAVLQTVHLFRENGAGAIVKNPLCMDRLRSLTCLVVPKEGVFTTRETVVDRVYAGDRLYDIMDRKSRRAMERPILYSILSTGMYGLSYLQAQSAGKTRDRVNTEEETAILNLARSMDIYNVRLDRAYPMIDHRGVGGDSLFDTTLVTHKEHLIAISRGEPEELLSRCAYYYKEGKILLLTPEIRTEILIAYRKLVRQAYSAVGVASRTHMYNNLKFIGAAQRDMVFEGIVAFRIPYLRGAAQLIADAKEAGIKIILLSERSVAAEAYFAKQMGIIEGREHCVDAAELRASKEGIRRTNASYYRLYCGLDTKQKQELLQNLMEAGEVVGVLGRRLEDLCLLRAADVSLAQNIAVAESAEAGKPETVVSKVSESAGEDGCEALKFESDIIVSDADKNGSGGFRGILDAIRIAKDTDLHIIRIIRYLLASQTARFLLVLYTILFSRDGMSAVQALFAGLFADFMAILVLAFQKPEPDALRNSMNAGPWLEHPLRNGVPSVVCGVCWACTAILASFFGAFAGFAQTEIQCGSILFVTSTICQIIMLFSVQREEFLWKPGIRMSALQALYLLALIELYLLFFLFPNFGTMFGVAKFDLRGALIIALFSAIMLIMTECVKMLARMRERPEIAAEEEQNGEHRSQIAELFHAFRAQKEEEERKNYGSVPEKPEKKPGKRRKPRTEAVQTAAAEASPPEAGAESVPDTQTEPAQEQKAPFDPAHAEIKEARVTDIIPAIDPETGKVRESEPPMREEHDKPRSFLAALFASHREKEKEKDEPSPDTAEMEAFVRTASEKAKERRKKHPHPADVRPARNPNRLFEEDDSDADDLLTAPGDDVLMAALKGRDPFASPYGAGTAETEFPELPVLPDEEDYVTLSPDELPDADGIPDPEAYEEAASHGITGEDNIGDITVGGTKAALRGFLREDKHRQTAGLEMEENNEFSGIGYLFSEEEYEAIMAEFNRDGVRHNLYDTQTQPFDKVGGNGNAEPKS